MLRFLSILSLFASTFALCAPVSLTVSDGAVKFLAVGKPSAIKIHGEGKNPSGGVQIDGANVTGQLQFKLDSFTTRIDLRDHHMKERYLEIGKYPNSTLTITKLALPAPWSADQSGASVPFEGTLSLHGVTQPVKGTVAVQKNASGASAHATFDLKISDFKIELPNYLGIKVADQVTVDADVNAK